MARVRRIVVCANCGVEFHPHAGQTEAKFCSRRCNCVSRMTPDSQRAAGRRGGRVIGERTRGTGTKGYIKRDGRHEHRLVAEQTVGRPLGCGEVVHHKDGDKHNNDPTNLVVLTRAEHLKLHLHSDPTPSKKSE